MRLSKKITGIAIGLITATSICVVAAAGSSLSNTFALSRTVSSSDYTTEFSMRTMIDGEEKMLRYDAENETLSHRNLIETTNIAESMCTITFINNNTITIKNGNHWIGYDTTGNTAYITDTETNWTLVDGQVQIADKDDKIHTLAFRTKDTSQTYNYGRAYKASNVTPTSTQYYQVYFYTQVEYNNASERCSWDSDRSASLNNLKYTVPVYYTVSFDANGGTGNMDSIQVLELTEYALPVNEFTPPDNKVFNGWSLSPNGDIITSVTVDSDKTVYALWKDKPEGSTVDFTLTSASSVTQNGVTVTFAKASGSNAPAWYAAGLRLYASNTITITCSNNITNITLNWEKQGSKTFATATANVGTYTHPSAAGQGTWTGSATTIVITVGSSGQLQLNTFSVTYE